MPENTAIRWIRRGSDGLATRALWIWALGAGVYAVCSLAVAVRTLMSYVGADVRSAGVVSVGLFVIGAVMAVSAEVCVVHAVPAARGQLRPSALRRLGRLLRTGGRVLAAVIVVSALLAFFPARGAAAETLDQVAAVAVAALMPAILLRMLGGMCERAFEVFAKGRR
ncbi:hypothetical protein [Actinopolymorpha pittospori]|uniref:Uncharacterized protein n=1 Tax=Actinopolymorpha pittospori TaxID=648752 RepID=A0A927N5R2_9ACTN|nr:hypothetical protein [Actinopolymorpha pittospori]MBE1611483.1 hypothetical protein [Actinopolymorpha pittospori]